jgi:hypothetical protein
MKHLHSTYPSFLKLCVAAAVAGPLVAMAGTPEFAPQGQTEKPIAQTDRMIVKYKDAKASAKGAAVDRPWRKAAWPS